jgi:hypothetical protein
LPLAKPARKHTVKVLKERALPHIEVRHTAHWRHTGSTHAVSVPSYVLPAAFAAGLLLFNVLTASEEFPLA